MNTYCVSLAGNDANDGSSAHPWRHVQYAMDFCRTDSVAKQCAQTIQLADGHFPEVVGMSGAGNAIFLKGNAANSRAVTIDGLQVRDYAVCLHYNLSLPWFALDQSAIVDAFDFVLCAGASPFGYQIACNRNSNLNLYNYSIDAGCAGGHMTANLNANIGQGSGQTVSIAGGGVVAYLSGGTRFPFYRPQFGGGIYLGGGINYVNGETVTATPVDATNRGICYRAGNSVPGSLYWPNIVGDGLIL